MKRYPWEMASDRFMWMTGFTFGTGNAALGWSFLYLPRVPPDTARRALARRQAERKAVR